VRKFYTTAFVRSIDLVAGDVAKLPTPGTYVAPVSGAPNARHWHQVVGIFRAGDSLGDFEGVPSIEKKVDGLFDGAILVCYAVDDINNVPDFHETAFIDYDLVEIQVAEGEIHS
jgi:hypothetical protein